MTGPEHYAAAERYTQMGEPFLVLAQIHATLALAAATADTTFAAEYGPAYGYGIDKPTSVTLPL
jgi:hypothetical protein